MKCKYRNCDNEPAGQINKLYCNHNCRSCESKYVSREKKSLINKIENQRKELDLIKYIKSL